MNLNSVIFTFLGMGAIFIVMRQGVHAALISAQPEESQDYNESTSLSFIDSVEQENHSVSENLVLTTSQGIQLKEIRKLARLAGHEQPETITEFDAQVCYANDCLEAAKEFYTSMDFTKDPCTEWGKFSCQWRTLSSKSALDQLSALSLNVENQVLDILQDFSAETEVMESAHEYFRICLNWFQDFGKIGHIAKYLQSFGNWPLLEGSDFEGDWVKLLAEIIRIVPENVSPLLFKFTAAAVSSKKIVIQIDIGSTYLEMDEDDMQQVLQILRRNSSPATERELADIHEMQNCMQKLSVGKYDSNAESNPSLMTLEDLQTKLTAQSPSSEVFVCFCNSWTAGIPLNIIKLMQAVFAETNLEIGAETEVLVNADSILKYLNVIESVDKRALVNILFLQLTTLLLGDATNVIEEVNFPYLENYKRPISRNPSHHCIMETSRIFSYALSEEYIRRYYKEKSDEMINRLTENLKNGFIAVIDKIKWLQTSSREFLTAKVKNIEPLIGFPKWILNDTHIISYYSNLKFTGNKSDTGVYLRYRTSALSWLNGKSWKLKLEDTNMNGWNFKEENGFIGDTNVEYIPSLSQIRIPAGVLQLPLYSDHFPGFMNFGGIGSVIAREMARLIDPKGIYMSNEGDLGMWLDEKSLKSYIDWSSQLQAEWDNNGDNNKYDLSLNDKIIHVFAYHITVKGYEEYLKGLKIDGKDELNLPGLVYLQPETLLQIKYTNVLCEDPTIQRSRGKPAGHQLFGRDGLIPVLKSIYFQRLFECDNLDKISPAFDLA